MEGLNPPDLGDPQVNANDIIAWLEDQPEASLTLRSQEIYEQLLTGASQPRHSSVLACTRLCGFVQHCAKSRHAPVRTWAFSEPTSMTLFNFYIEWNEKDQHRSMKLVLDLLLVLIGQNPDPKTAAAVRSQILVSLVSIITRQSTRPLVKSCINSLNHLFGRSVYDLDDIARTYREVEPAVAALPELDLWRRFCGDLVSWMYLHYVCSVAGKFIVTLFKALLARSSIDNSNLQGFTVQTWLSWLHRELRVNPGILENMKLYVFGPLFKDRPLSLELLDILNRPTESGEGSQGELDSIAVLRLAALEVGKKSGLVDDPGSASSQKASKSVVLDVQVMESVLSHPSPPVRLLALSLLVTSPSLSKPYPSEALRLIRRHLPSYYSDPGAGFRQEALTYTKIMIKRVRGTITFGHKPAAQTGALTKAAAKPTQAELKHAVSREALEDHEAFFDWYLGFLLGELVPTASYQRHITALRAVLQVVQSGKDISSESATTRAMSDSRIFLDYSWIRSILDLVVDPFSDVRETAISLLMLAPQAVVKSPISRGNGQHSTELWDVVREFRIQASALASRTGRADHGDGTARLQGLLCSWSTSLDHQLELLDEVINEIDKKLGVAKHDISQAVVEQPVHGDFASISCIWEVLTKTKYPNDDLQRLVAVQKRVVEYCRQIWSVVKPILCDDSPEGHLPQEMEDAEGLDTKGLLSYSFRAIHESSNTMRLFLAPLRLSRMKGALLPSREVFGDIGNLTFEQLSNLRHRGAFSTVSLTFTTCCQLVEDPLVTSPEAPAEERLLFSWYKGTIDCIFAQVSTTRRSAGIPALMTGILAANATRPSFDEVINKLGEIAQRPARAAETDGSNLPQVHALNCVKDVFKSSLLSMRAERYLPTFLQVAASSLRSELWAIRNCGLLLLRSVIDCLLGNSDSKALLESGWDGRTIRISYVKYPTLPTILIGLLQSGQGAHDTESQRRAAESVFPALDIIRRAGPPDSHRDQLYVCVSEYLASHLWHVREIAARTLSSFLVSMDWLTEIQGLLEKSQNSANRLHGTLLTIKFLMEKSSEVAADDHKLPILLFALDAVSGFGVFKACSDAQAVHLEVYSLILRSLRGNPDGTTPLREEILAILSDDPDSTSPALLRVQLGLEAARWTAARGDADLLRDVVLKLATLDSNAAALVVESIPRLWASEAPSSNLSQLCQAYIEMVCRTPDLEIRCAALNNITSLLDGFVAGKDASHIPSPRELNELWAAIHSSECNPSTLQASIRASGPIMASLALQHGQNTAHEALDRQLRAWAVVISEAGHADNAFDMREAAAMAIKSFALAAGTWCTKSAAYLPFLLALYDTLNDDDEEIRDVGTAAATPVLGRLLVPVQAADELLERMTATFAACSAEFANHAVLRALGETRIRADPGPGPGQPPVARRPGDQLREALMFDDSLFVVEEQNLFVDEVREARRWAGVAARLPADGCGRGGGGTLGDLRDWAAEGLEALTRHAAGSADAPLGWASQPKAFDVCSRIIINAESFSAAFQDEELASALASGREVWEKAGLHGTLVRMAGKAPSAP
ncbi:hypothetical protein RB594_002984 [Gaeumannomyces avenae]